MEDKPGRNGSQRGRTFSRKTTRLSQAVPSKVSTSNSMGTCGDTEATDVRQCKKSKSRQCCDQTQDRGASAEDVAVGTSSKAGRVTTCELHARSRVPRRDVPCAICLTYLPENSVMAQLLISAGGPVCQGVSENEQLRH